MVPSSLSCLSPHFAYMTVLHFVDCVSNTLLLCALVQVCWCLANTVWPKFYESAKYFAECSCSAALVHDVNICIPDKTNSGEKQCVSRIDKAADKEGGSLESSILNDAIQQRIQNFELQTSFPQPTSVPNKCKMPCSPLIILQGMQRRAEG